MSVYNVVRFAGMQFAPRSENGAARAHSAPVGGNLASATCSARGIAIHGKTNPCYHLYVREDHDQFRTYLAFELFTLHELPGTRVARATGLSRNAVYEARNRIEKTMQSR